MAKSNYKIFFTLIFFTFFVFGCTQANGAKEQAIATGESNINETLDKSYSLAEVSVHSSRNDCWLAVNGKVYDVTSYISMHPAGENAIIQSCGTEATSLFNSKHSAQAKALLEDYLKGTLK